MSVSLYFVYECSELIRRTTITLLICTRFYCVSISQNILCFYATNINTNSLKLIIQVLTFYRHFPRNEFNVLVFKLRFTFACQEDMKLIVTEIKILSFMQLFFLQITSLCSAYLLLNKNDCC